MGEVKIGFFELKEDKVFRNTYETAAWHQDILVSSGIYPIYGEVKNTDLTPRMSPGQIEDTSLFSKLEGRVVSSDFSSLFFGNTIAQKINENVGEQSVHVVNPYAHSIALSIIKGEETKFKLNDDFHARKSYYVQDGKVEYTGGIFKKNDDLVWKVQQRMNSGEYVLCARGLKNGSIATIVFEEESFNIGKFVDGKFELNESIENDDLRNNFIIARDLYLKL